MKYSHAENIFELTSENSIVVITYDKVKCIINLIVIDIDTVEICDLHVIPMQDIVFSRSIYI